MLNITNQGWEFMIISPASTWRYKASIIRTFTFFILWIVKVFNPCYSVYNISSDCRHMKYVRRGPSTVRIIISKIIPVQTPTSTEILLPRKPNSITPIVITTMSVLTNIYIGMHILSIPCIPSTMLEPCHRILFINSSTVLYKIYSTH